MPEEYADVLERLSSSGFSSADARRYADNGIVPEAEEEEEDAVGCTCRIGSEFCSC